MSSAFDKWVYVIPQLLVQWYYKYRLSNPRDFSKGTKSWPELESLISRGNVTRSPIWPSACIAIEASVAVSETTTSTRHLSVFWNNVSGICQNICDRITNASVNIEIKFKLHFDKKKERKKINIYIYVYISKK